MFNKWKMTEDEYWLYVLLYFSWNICYDLNENTINESLGIELDPINYF